MKVGTIVTYPVRVDFLNGDYKKAYKILVENGIKIVYKTVASVHPYHATLHLSSPSDLEKAKELLSQNNIKFYPPTPFY